MSMKNPPPKSILIIQTAFLGDVILATALIEKLHTYFPESSIDFLLRKGNEEVLAHHPKLRKVLIWNKQQSKFKNLLQLLFAIRKEKYDLVINIQRFASTGFLAGFSGGKSIIGFDKNPWSFLFTRKIPHTFEGHEVSRNLKLVEDFTSTGFVRPALYPSVKDQERVVSYRKHAYCCIAPASVWFTKQFPKEKWVDMINHLSTPKQIFLLGSKSDIPLCEEIISLLKNNSVSVINLAGKLSITETAALMEHAEMNFVNDSAPLHIASAMNAPVTAVFCSTVPAFGFGPLSDISFVAELKEKLYCRPCGIHGYQACPEGHFKCAHGIAVGDLVEKIG